jgi:acetolactate synthase-1/2/3 large subunit
MSIGIHTAQQNSTPLVALVGQVRRAHLGREAFQEVDLASSFGRLAKWSGQVDDAADAARLVGEGLTAMLEGRPGPVLFSLPEDVLDESLDAAEVARVQPGRPQPPGADVAAEVVSLLQTAERPAILAGGGVTAAGARDALVELSERLEVPVFAAWRRPAAFPNDHPHFLGMTGYGSPATALGRLEEADALLVIGCRLNEIASFEYRIPSKRTRWAHVDLAPRGSVAGLRRPDIAVAADAADFLAAALEASSGYTAPAARVAALREDRSSYLAATEVIHDPEWRGPGVHPGLVVDTLNRVMPDDAILTTDAGNFGLWAARYYRFKRETRFLAPTSGAMGYGLPAAIAASLAEPKRKVVALCGDGGLAMTMNEFETAVRMRTRPVVLVFDNRRYGTIAMHQRNEGREETATRLGPIDFAAVARACGAQGGRITRDAEFEPALHDALGADRPALLHLEMDPRWITPDRFDG